MLVLCYQNQSIDIERLTTSRIARRHVPYKNYFNTKILITKFNTKQNKTFFFFPFAYAVTKIPGKHYFKTETEAFDDPTPEKTRTLINLRHTHQGIFTLKRKSLRKHNNQHDHTKYVTKQYECVCA